MSYNRRPERENGKHGREFDRIWILLITEGYEGPHNHCENPTHT